MRVVGISSGLVRPQWNHLETRAAESQKWEITGLHLLPNVCFIPTGLFPETVEFDDSGIRARHKYHILRPKAAEAMYN